jgi:hypothetical protein
MTGNVYNRPMFRMANGGMAPPLPPEMVMGGPPMPPGGMPPMGPPGGMPPMGPPGGMPPEVMQAASQAVSEGTDEMLMEGIQKTAEAEAGQSMSQIDAAEGYDELMNIVWDDNLGIEDYRTKLAQVVGRDDADRTPDSVLALVQPTLALAQLDQGIGALMQEELAEVGMEGEMGGGIMENVGGLGAKAAVADNMALETGAMVDAIGGIANPQGGGMEEIAMAEVEETPRGMEEIMMEAVGQV